MEPMENYALNVQSLGITHFYGWINALSKRKKALVENVSSTAIDLT